MTESANLFREVKLVTRSLLLSAPNGLSVRSFVTDYLKHNGQEFPYRELGYKSAEDLLMDLPDAVRMEWLPHRGGYLLKGIADESTKHIENLVKKQRKSKQVYHNVPPGFQKLNKEASRSYSDNSYHPRRSADNFFLKKMAQQHLIGAVPVKIRSQIRQLLSSFEDGLLLSNFEIAFKKEFGTDFPFVTLGFSSLEDCLRRIPDVVLRDSGSLLKVYPVRRKQNEEHGRSLKHSSASGSEASEQPKKSAVNGVIENGCNPINCMYELDQFYSLESSPKYNNNQGNCLSRNHCTKFDSNISVKSRNYKSDSFSSNIGNGCHLGNKTCVENNFNSGAQNDRNGNSFSVRNSHDALELRSPETESERDDDDISALSTVNLSFDDGISVKMKRNFQRVLELHPEGVWATEFLDKYSAITRQKLDISELGYFSLIEMVSALPEIFAICRLDFRKDDWLLVSADNPKHRKKGNCYVTLPPEAPRYPMTLDVFVGLQYKLSETFPSDAAISDCSFQKQTLPEDLSRYVGVYVGEVEHPSQLWIQFRGETTSRALEVLMQNLENLYYGNGDDYKMPTRFVEVGRVCAAVWSGDNSWRRAVVTGIPNKEFAEVFFVDYGTKENVRKSSLRFLKNQFLSLPAQALKARLAHILPAVGKRWCGESKRMLLSLCSSSNKPFSALITNTEYEERLSVCLCDVSQECDFHINDHLVQRGYAKAAKDPYCVVDAVVNMDYSQPSSPMSKIQQNVNEFALASPNYDALTEFMNVAAMLSQLSNSRMNAKSLSQLLSSPDLSAHKFPHADFVTSLPSDSVSHHEGNWTDEQRESFEEGDEFYE